MIPAAAAAAAAAFAAAASARRRRKKIWAKLKDVVGSPTHVQQLQRCAHVKFEGRRKRLNSGNGRQGRFNAAVCLLVVCGDVVKTCNVDR